MANIIVNDRTIQIAEQHIEKFERQVNKNRIDKFSRFLQSVKEKNNLLQFEKPTLFPRLLRLLPKTTLTTQQQASILLLFREKNGLPPEGVESDILLELLKFADTICDKALIDYCITHISKKIKESNDTNLLQLLVEQTRHFKDRSFLELLKDWLFPSLFKADCTVQFNEKLVKELEACPLEFATRYLDSKKIPFAIFLNNKLRISLHDFIALFDNKKDLEILKFMATAIDTLSLKDNNFAGLYLIPKHYRNAIQYIFYSADFRVTPAEVEELQQLFLNMNYQYLIMDLKLEEIEKAIETDPKNAFFHLLLGNVHFAADEDDKGEEAYEMALRLNTDGSKSAFVCYALGCDFDGQDLWDKAEEQLREALELDPKLAPAHERLGVVLMKQKHYDEAEMRFRKAIELNPNTATAPYQLNEMLEKNKEIFDKKRERAKLYEQDRSSIETNSKKTIRQKIKELNGRPEKFSRRNYSYLTHSYYVTPNGTLLQQLHKNQGILAHHVKDDLQVVLGKGGIKIANAMANASGAVSDVRAVVCKEGPISFYAAEACKNEKFKSSKYLLVGSHMLYPSVKIGKSKHIFFMPYIARGDLSQKTLTIKEARHAMLPVALGLQTVHHEGWAHLDIKPSNILGNKLADFDLCVNFNHANSNKKITRGTPGYESPEILRGECCGKEAAQQSDMFAFGITMLEVCGFSIRKLICPPSMSQEEQNETVRGAMKELLDVPWLSGQFDTFKNQYTPLGYEDKEYLDLAWNLISQEGPKRPTIDSAVEILRANAL